MIGARFLTAGVGFTDKQAEVRMILIVRESEISV